MKVSHEFKNILLTEVNFYQETLFNLFIHTLNKITVTRSYCKNCLTIAGSFTTVSGDHPP